MFSANQRGVSREPRRSRRYMNTGLDCRGLSCRAEIARADGNSVVQVEGVSPFLFCGRVRFARVARVPLPDDAPPLEASIGRMRTVSNFG